jgi:hypothetical protein
MTQSKMILQIMEMSKIHHNITTHGLKLPNPPKGLSDEGQSNAFNDACESWIDLFITEAMEWPSNDSGNRNLNNCIAEKHRLNEKGACIKHDLWHFYTTGRSGATLYWDKYWDENKFKCEQYELEQMTLDEVKTIYDDLDLFTNCITDLRSRFPEDLAYSYKEMAKIEHEAAKEEALGYNKTLRDLLNDENPQIVRLAKGIKSELSK